VNFEKTRDYETSNPLRLKEQLQELEKRVERGLTDVERRGIGTITRINSATSPSHTHRIDELVIADTSVGDVTLLLPDPAKTKGRLLFAAKSSTANILIFTPLSSTANRTPTYGQTTRGLHAVMSDGVEYWVVAF